jgi:glucose/arabinose dehydrogenase
MKRTIFCFLLLAAWAASRPAAAAITTVQVASGLSGPVFVTAPPGDTERLFIVEFNTGKIKILKSGSVLSTPFLDIGSLVTDNFNFGLLGLAFHPDYANNGYFYVQYVDNSSRPMVARYTVSSDPDVADSGSAQTVIQLSAIIDHQGGTVAFGPDGYLYVGFGDGQATDPSNRAQNDGDLHGKLLRLDVDGGTPYAIPSDNPFVGPGDPLDEIWAKGFRNPFRFTFDRLTGNLYIGDVGQEAREEIDFQPAASGGGENYGWRLKEGTVCFNPPTGCDPGGLTDPIHEYVNTGSGCSGSVTGGSVYRGSAIPELQGAYLFADYCFETIWSFRYDGTTLTELVDRTSQLAPGGGLQIDNPVAIGEDGQGELYIVDINGEIFQIVSTTPLVPALGSLGRGGLAALLVLALVLALRRSRARSQASRIGRSDN